MIVPHEFCYVNKGIKKICIARLTSQIICGKMIINPEFLERSLPYESL
nr:MAG TPA: hypothetical protein [Caudoviricetes sp.]